MEKPFPLPVPSGLKKVSPLVFFLEMEGLPILPNALHLFLKPEYLKIEIRVV